jgi:large subunit ribosomal protein L15
MNLHDVNKGIKKNKRKRRVGRGPGSGWGKTAGRGHKGQGQLAGWSSHPAFEGGQMPLSRRIPKRGFNNQWAVTVKSVNVGDLDELFQDGEEVTPDKLRESNLAKSRYDVLKVLGDGDITHKLKISAHRFSKTALEKIQKAGGEAIFLPEPAPVVKRESRTKKKTMSDKEKKSNKRKVGAK